MKEAFFGMIYLGMICFALGAEPASGSKDMRTWTEATSGRTLRGRMDGKRDAGKEARIVLESGKAVWIPVSKLSEEDRKFVASWEVLNMRMEAKTVAMGTDRSQWSCAWIAESRDAAALLAASGSEQVSGRSVGITIDNRGTAKDVVVDVFWLGFPLNEKTKRVVCCRSTRVVKVPPEDRYTISCQAGYRYREDSLAYVHANFRTDTITGLFVDTWQGYGYAGWIVRISDTSGKMIAEQGSQPALLRYIQDVPCPVAKK